MEDDVAIWPDGSKTERIVWWKRELNWEDEDKQGCDNGVETSPEWTSYEMDKRVADNRNKQLI